MLRITFVVKMSKKSIIISISLVLLLIMQAQPAKAKMNKTELIRQFLEGQNKARKEVGIAPLVWDNLLSTYARIYSSRERRKDCKLIHSSGLFGENLFWGQGAKWAPKDAVAAWVAEKKWYNYTSNSCGGPACGHYTQVIWSETKRVGCAKMMCDSGDSFMSCEYYPAGNYEGERPY